jgi:hypothetical protein
MKVPRISFTNMSAPKSNFRPSFTAYEGDDLSPYDNYRGEKPPRLEEYKYERSVEAQRHIERGEYAQAANIKLELAQICKGQGKFEDADKLVAGAKELLDETV